MRAVSPEAIVFNIITSGISDRATAAIALLGDDWSEWWASHTLARRPTLSSVGISNTYPCIPDLLIVDHRVVDRGG